MSRQDRATREFFEAFTEDARAEGARIHDAGGVIQIHGSRILVEARVRDGEQEFRTALKLSGSNWIGYCNDESHAWQAPVFATMLEKIRRGDALPAAAPVGGDGEQSIYEMAASALRRGLQPDEEVYLGKVEKRFRRWESTEEIYDTDLVRLNSSWEIVGYDPLVLWPTPPANLLEFWNYIAYAFDKKRLGFPDFMRPLTDLDAVQAKLEVWERERELARWNREIHEFIATPRKPDRRGIAFRFLITADDAKLQQRVAGEDDFLSVETPAEYAAIVAAWEAGAFVMDAVSELLLAHFQHYWNEHAKLDMDLREAAAASLLNLLFHQEMLRASLVNLDEVPLTMLDESIEWACEETADERGEPGWQLQLLAPGGDRIPHSLRLLPGSENLYLSDDCVFRGPVFWNDGTEVLPCYEIGAEIIETGAGIEFLDRIGAELPVSLRDRVRQRPLLVTIEFELKRGATTADSEHVTVRVVASDSEGERVEALGKSGWEVEQQPTDDGDGTTLYHYDRSALYFFPALLEELRAGFDQGLGLWKIRMTRNFPEKFVKWAGKLPPGVKLDPVGEMATLLDDPVQGSFKLEVENAAEGIDWFDIRTSIEVQGHDDLDEEELRALLAARGDYVRVRGRGWMRLELKMVQEAREAVERLGIDAFDMSGKSHRMHVLQLADPGAREVFNQQAWEDISARAGNLKLRVRPMPSRKLEAELRPYQVEGFHFLSYLATNCFGGILADDMGLGKTMQALAWILWLRENSEDKKPAPALVVAPKSVLDVWAAEIERHAPTLSFQVLRNREDLDVKQVLEKIDVLIINYAQLRAAIEELREVCWIAAVLDEGQQIKNPDSKAAKASRRLEAENRLVLSGTPIENRLLDVWSLMAFAMPGVLGDRKYFRERFDRRKDTTAQQRLTARLRPFLLRRTKDQVALDLPPKVEEEVLCQMEDAQRELYDGELQRAQASILEMGADGVKKNSFAVLQALMRLRQICCHPALVDSAYHGVESAKMEALFYLLGQLREEGHKVLVFSQFTSLLALVEERLEEEERPYFLLTGKTENRSEVVRDFQRSKEADVFLLSLKAGGSGLNLTAASYVILFDPWWNPAVEAQAIDRTHRIGQVNHVMAYRLITRDTVEEKIRRLQAQKQDLVKGVLGASDTSFTSNLDMEDLRFLLGAGA